MAVTLSDGTTPRTEVPEEFTWNRADIYDSVDAWRADIENIQELLPALAAFQGTLNDGPQALLGAMQTQEKIGELLIKVYAYAMLANDENTADPETQAWEDRARGLAVMVGSQSAFLEPEIIALPDGRVESYLTEEPELGIYRHALEDLVRQKEHVLDAATEQLLAAGGEVFNAPGTIFGMIDDADMRYGTVKNEDGEEVTLTKAVHQRFMESRDRRVRKDSFTVFHTAYQRQSNTLAATYASSVKSDVYLARARKYETALQASLEPHNIPIAVYDSLVKAVNDHLPAMHQYVALRKRALGLDSVAAYDFYVPIVPEVDVEFSYDEAVEMVLAGLAPLGEKYVEDVRGAITNRWIDVYENQGKRSGGYSMGVHGVHPYILLNWSGRLNDVFTLAHELGHAMHSNYTSNTQPYVYGNYTLFVAEVASTVNEMLLSRHLRATTDDAAFDAYLVNNAIDDMRGTLFRQTKFAEFERWAHERIEGGEALTAEVASAQYNELMRRYYGPDVTLDELTGIEWARVPHFYRAYYVYQYATGISAAAALSQQILDEGEPARERYLTFLSSGSSKYSLDLLRDAGVDMTKPEPVNQALKLFGGWVNELEGLLEE